MKKFFFLFAFGLSISVAANNSTPTEKTTASIEGKVLDAENAEALTGASIYFVELDLKVYASFDGSFEIEEIPTGTYTVEVSYISYEPVVYKDFEVKEGMAYKKFLL
ncbi:MAG: carboxypeptidase-like regulatory domain-containing protein [Cryomorphaceae bacterium]|nr:carboxypeptidase-like regulatory domain-containing protein [Flavobacteriales bacterium]